MRVPRTFVFVDLTGFTNYTAACGDDAAGAILQIFRNIIREVASNRGVRIAKWLGDGCMMVSVDQELGIAAALDLEAKAVAACAPLSVRVGVATGYALLFEGDDYIGSAVNLASRLCDSAEPHEILAGVELGPFVPSWAHAEPIIPVAIRGFAHRVPVMRLQRRVDGDLVLDPICGMEIPTDAVGATRPGPEGGDVGFCAESCALAWDEKTPLA